MHAVRAAMNETHCVVHTVKHTRQNSEALLAEGRHSGLGNNRASARRIARRASQLRAAPAETLTRDPYILPFPFAFARSIAARRATPSSLAGAVRVAARATVPLLK